MTVRLPEIGLGCVNLIHATLPELIDAAEGNGFRRFTASPAAFAAALNDGWSEAKLRKRIDDAGLQVTMIDALTKCLPGVRSRAELDESTRAALPESVLDPPDAETGLRAAEVLGSSVVNITHHLGVPTPVAALAPAVAGVCRRAGERCLMVSLEFIPDTGIPDLATAQAVVEASGEANIGILLDVFHHDRSGGDVADIQRLPPGAIVAVQLSDRVSAPPGTPHIPLTGRVLPGEGQLPLRELVQAALKNNPDLTIDVEVLNRQILDMPPSQAAACLAESIQRWRTAFESAA